MALISLRRRSHANTSMVLTRAEYYYTQLYKITSKYCNTYCNGRAGLESRSYFYSISDVLATEPLQAIQVVPYTVKAR